MSRQGNHEIIVAEELKAIAVLSRADLIEKWQATFGRLPPKGISRRLLEYSAAYTIQVKAFGGLKPPIKRKLEGRGGAEKRKGEKNLPSTSELAVGARLVREWHGQTHTVDVVGDRFRYDGRDFKSLSQIAREITGTRWSGPRFFGL